MFLGGFCVNIGMFIVKLPRLTLIILILAPCLTDVCNDFRTYSALIPAASVTVSIHALSLSKQLSTFLADSQKLDTRMLGSDAEKQMLNVYRASIIPTNICVSHLGSLKIGCHN